MTNMNNVKPLIKLLNNVTEDHKGSRRLYYFHNRAKLPYDYPGLAKAIVDYGKTPIYVLDSSFIARHEIDWCVWEALLDRKVVIPEAAWKELRDWRLNPFGNQRIARVLSSEGRNSVWIEDRESWDRDLRVGTNYYTTLLSMRKQRSKFLIDSSKRLSGDEIKAIFQKHGRERDYHLLRKGHSDSGKSNYFADESVVVTAITLGLLSGRPTVILTRDNDVLEQFQKLTHLLLTHYQATLFAEFYSSAPDSFMVRPMPRGIPNVESKFFPEESILVRKPVENLDHFLSMLLPLEYQPVRMTCCLLGGNPPDLALTCLNFESERDMLKTIYFKGKTNGLSTDKLSGRNCHVTGLPQGISDSRSWVAITRDKLIPLKRNRIKLSLFDATLTWQHREKWGRLTLNASNEKVASPSTS